MVDNSTATVTPPLLLDIKALAVLLARSVPSLHRDDAAGRLPAAVRIGGSKRWRHSDITAWVEMGCPDRAEFEARIRA
jgi:predicted DNA-binding transcriptional regulator AlpA